MRNVGKALSTGLAILALALPAQSQEAGLVIRNVSVVDVAAGRTLPAQDVRIEAGRIAAVGPTGASADGAAGVIDGTGKTLIPGLWDAHVHVFTVPGEEDVALPVTLAHGITSIRDVGAFRTREEILAVQAELAEGRRPGPHLYLAGAVISGPPGAWPGIAVASTPEEGRALVRGFHAEGWTSVKVYSLLQPAVVAAIADEAGKLGLPVYGHVSEAVSLAQALEAGQQGIEHIDKVRMACSMDDAAIAREVSEVLKTVADRDAALRAIQAPALTAEVSYDAARCAAIARDMAEGGVWVTPTMNVADFYLGRDPAPDDPRFRTVPEAVRAMWAAGDARRAGFTDEDRKRVAEADALNKVVVGQLQEAGVTIIAGSDAGFMNPYSFHGASLLAELDRLAASGLSPAAVLAAATIDPARLFAPPDRAARIEAGQVADLVLLAGDPLRDLAALGKVAAVIREGVLYDRAALDALLADAEAAGQGIGAGD